MGCPLQDADAASLPGAEERGAGFCNIYSNPSLTQSPRNPVFSYKPSFAHPRNLVLLAVDDNTWAGWEVLNFGYIPFAIAADQAAHKSSSPAR